MKYDGRMDPECMALCDALNALPGISTFESCCGHGEHPFRIWFFAERVSDLKPAIEHWHHLDYEWRIEVAHVDCPYRVVFMLEGPARPTAGDELVSRIE
jgi:hypothetical protein